MHLLLKRNLLIEQAQHGPDRLYKPRVRSDEDRSARLGSENRIVNQNRESNLYPKQRTGSISGSVWTCRTLEAYNPSLLPSDDCCCLLSPLFAVCHRCLSPCRRRLTMAAICRRRRRGVSSLFSWRCQVPFSWRVHGWVLLACSSRATKCRCDCNIHTNSAKSRTHLFYLFFLLTPQWRLNELGNIRIQDEAISKENFLDMFNRLKNSDGSKHATVYQKSTVFGQEKHDYF